MIQSKNCCQEADILIIGAGPVGLFAAFQAHLFGFSCIIVDSLTQIGGQCHALYPDKPIFDIPAIPKCSAKQLITQLQIQLSPFNTPIFLETTIISIKTHAEFSQKNKKETETTTSSNSNCTCSKKRRWEALTEHNTNFFSDYIILATGSGRPVPQNLAIPGIDFLTDKYIHYKIKNTAQFNGKRITIIGGGDSAIDWALTLCHQTSLTLIHRRKKFNAQPHKIHALQEALHKKLLHFYLATVKNIICDEKGKLIALECDNNSGPSFIKTDHILVFFGLILMPCPIIFHNQELSMSQNLISVDLNSFQTSINTVFGCGDAITYQNKQKLILSGFHEAALVIRSIFRDQTQNKHQAGHSSNNTTLLEIYKETKNTVL